MSQNDDASPASDAAELRAALERYEISVPDEAIGPLVAYARAMWAWNEKLNLTRHTTWDLYASRDLLDCVQLASHLEEGEEVLDLGSGNGIPGIPLALLRPDLQVSLAESVGKKAKVLNDLVETLDLPVAVYAARGEDLLEDFRFDTVVIRAVGSLLKICTWLRPHFASIGRVLVLKGPRWVEERGEARHHGVMKGLELRRLATYPMPESENEGVILQIRKPRPAS